MVKAHPALFATKHWHVLQILSQYNRAVGHFSDVVRYDLTITDRMSRLHSYVKPTKFREKGTMCVKAMSSGVYETR